MITNRLFIVLFSVGIVATGEASAMVNGFLGNRRVQQIRQQQNPTVITHVTHAPTQSSVPLVIGTIFNNPQPQPQPVVQPVPMVVLPWILDAQR